MTRRRIRIRFAKEGDLRWLGHLDLVRAWERMFRRAGVALAMSAGFHPRPRIRFPSAQPLGEAGREEVIEAEIDGDASIASLQEALLQAAPPPGLRPTRLVEVPLDGPDAVIHEAEYELPLPAGEASAVAARVEKLLAQETLLVERRAGRTVDLRDLLLAARVEGDVLRFRVRVLREGSLRARDILAALGLTELVEKGDYATRIEVELV